MEHEEALRTHHPTDRLVGKAPAIQALCQQIRHLAGFDTVGNPHAPTVLLQGETGTGKGLVARIIHDSGPRAKGPFLDINCAAIPAALLEAELFGFEAGAFTDAKRAKPGLFEAASGGTLFLDEIEALPTALQSKLLTAVEAKRTRRLGAVAERPIDAKLIAATQTDLRAAVSAGRFRADLYHRLAVVVLTLPPVRERGDDILGLARHFLRRYAEVHGLPPKALSRGAEAWLLRYDWPGNVRELSHLMERVTLLSPEMMVSRERLEWLCLPRLDAPLPPESVPIGGEDLRDEPTRIRRALVQAEGNVMRAARLLGLGRGALRHRMRRYGIGVPGRERLSYPSGARAAEGEDHPRALPWRQSGQAEAASPRQNRMTDTPAGQAAPIIPSDWARKPVTVLAISVTFPEPPAGEAPGFEPWTMAARWQQHIEGKVNGFGGMLLLRSPSLLVAAFGLPRTVEQLPQCAVHAALAIRQSVAEAAGSGERASCPEVRLAVHGGGVLVDAHMGDTAAHVLPVGETLTLPVRLLGCAAPDEILLSSHVGRLVEGWYELQRREVPATGGKESLVVYALIRPEAQPSPLERMGQRALSRFVGRDRELTTLREIFAQAQRGRGQVVGVVGEPGIGKSRLLYEFRRQLAADPILSMEAHCSSYGTAVPYRPLLDLLHAYFQLDDRGVEQPIRDKIASRLLGLDEALRPALPAFLTLLDVPVDDPPWQALDPLQRRQRILDALKRLLVRESQVQPLLLVFENLHWIDAETQAFLDSLVESLPAARLLLLVTYRPEYQHGWGQKTYYTQLRLDPLPPASAEALLQSLLGGDAGLDLLTQRLIERTQGNPFFLEESVRTLVETQVLAGEPGAFRLTQTLPSIQVPATVQAVLAARIDRLPPEEKQLLQVAAVIGREVPFALLQTIAELPDDALRVELSRLQAAEFLYERSLFPAVSYTFKHALTQEVAYDTVLLERRRVLHERVAQAIEMGCGGRLEEQYSTLAQHYTRSGNASKAVDYLSLAGQQAVRCLAYAEAVSHLIVASDLLTTLPDTCERRRQELVVRMTLGTALRTIKGGYAPEVEQHYLRARALCEQVREPPKLFRVLWGLWGMYNQRGNAQGMRALGEQLLSLAQRLEDPDLLLEAHHALWTSLFSAGELLAARMHQEQGLRLYDPQRHFAHAGLYSEHDPGVCCRYRAAPALWLLGYPDQALASSHAAVVLAQRLAQPSSLAHALYWAAVLHHLRREAPLTQARAEAVSTVATDREIPVQASYAKPLWGWALTVRGHGEEGRAQIQQALADDRPTRWSRDRPYHLALLAEASGHVRRPAAGLEVLDEALATVAQSAARWWEAELYRLRGELLLQCPGARPREAEACFQRALDIARHQQAKSLELRAAMSLSRLWQHRGQRGEAAELLAPIYDWFTEGFDTADLQDAMLLLEELS